MSKLLISFCLVTTALLSLSAYAFASTPISFGVDCMIHDNQGKMLTDLGMIGECMGSYTANGTFTYNDLTIEANLNGPFAEAPEVASPQIKLTVTDQNGAVVSSLVTTATPEINAALYIPTDNLYLHCDKMDMSQ